MALLKPVASSTALSRSSEETKPPMVALKGQEERTGGRVAEWYSGRSVLVTGATGYLGMLVVEKLLRSCPGILTVYLLVRPKRGQEPRERLGAYTSHVIFSKLRAVRPDFARHLSVVSGDVSAPDFRLAEQEMAALRRDVSVVFHCAASVRFDDSLRQAVTTNVVGTQRVMGLAEQLPGLQVFVHVSTSFCHSDHAVLEEKLYPPRADPEKIMDIVSWMDDDLLGAITSKLLGNLPNTYALSKNLSEELVVRYSDRLPIVLARPSLVIPCWKDPLPGWAANTNGGIGLLIATGKGVLRVLMVDLDVASDGLPADCMANALIVAAWHFVESRQQSPYVCNITNGDLKRTTFADLMKINKRIYDTDVPLRPVLWYCDPIVTKSAVVYNVCHFFLEFLPAHILDFFIHLSGRKPFLVHINNRLQSGQSMLRYYMLREWKFINRNIMSVYESLAPEDQETFYFNPGDVDLYQYFKTAMLTGKQYLLKERIDNIPSDLRYIRRMYWLHTAVRVLFYGLLLWLLYSWSQPAWDTLESATEYLVFMFQGTPMIKTFTEELPVPSSQNVAGVTNS